MPAARRYPSLFRGLTARIAVALVVLLISGLLAATLVRMAPGFGMDERMLDARLGSGSLQAIERQGAEHSNILRYYAHYLRQLSRGDFGISRSTGRPVRELLSERLALSLRSVAGGISSRLDAGAGGRHHVGIVAPRLPRGPGFAPGRSALVHPGSFSRAGLRLHRRHPGGGDCGNCVPADLPLRAGCGPSGWRRAARADGPRARLASRRILAFHVAPPVLPELLALGGISVSMALGSMVPVEALCDSPGVGQLVWQAAMARDLPVLVNVTLLLAAFTIGANLLADTARSAREVQA